MKLFKIHITRECSMTSGHCDQWFAAWQFLKKWLLIEDFLTIKEGRSHGLEDNRSALYFILIMWTVSTDVAIQRSHWQLPWSIHELTVPTQPMMWMMWHVKVDHTAGVYTPYTFRTVVWVVLCPTRTR